MKEAVKEMQDNTKFDKVCPHLGLKDDRETISAYPSQWNVCYKVSPVQTPNFSHQRSYCLSEKFSDCVVYKQQANSKMPIKLQHPHYRSIKKNKRLILLIGLLFIALLFVLVFTFRDCLIPGILEIDPSQTSEPRPTITMREVFTFTPVISFEIEPSSSPTLPASPTITSTPVTPTPTIDYPPLALETPIGLSYQFVIHRVDEGESLLLYANWYNTSAEAIQAVNVNLEYPIKIDDLIVIPIDLTDVTGLPAFEPYEVSDPMISIEDLAKSLTVDVEDLYLYNNIVAGQIIQRGEWILLPREETP